MRSDIVPMDLHIEMDLHIDGVKQNRVKVGLVPSGAEAARSLANISLVKLVKSRSSNGEVMYWGPKDKEAEAPGIVLKGGGRFKLKRGEGMNKVKFRIQEGEHLQEIEVEVVPPDIPTSGSNLGTEEERASSEAGSRDPLIKEQTPLGEDNPQGYHESGINGEGLEAQATEQSYVQDKPELLDIELQPTRLRELNYDDDNYSQVISQGCNPCPTFREDAAELVAQTQRQYDGCTVS